MTTDKQDWRFLVISATPPIVIAVIFTFLVPNPEAWRYSLDNPLSHTIWTSAFVHRSLSGFGTNMLVYVLAVAPSIYLFHNEGWGWAFNRSSLLILVVIPVISNSGTYLFFRYVVESTSGITSGAFPSLIGAYLGVFFSGLIATMLDEYGVIAGLYMGISGVIGSLSAIAFRSSSVHLGYTVLGIMTIFVLWGDRARQSEIFNPPDGFDISKFLLRIYGVVLLSTFAGFLFPTDWVRGTEYVNIFGRFTGFTAGTAIGLILSIILVYSEEIRIEFRVRKPVWTRRIGRGINEFYSRRWWVHSIGAIIAAIAGGLLSNESPVVAAATVFYASMLFFQTFDDQPVAKIQNFSVKTPDDPDPAISVDAQLKNTGEANIEKGFSRVRIRDPVTQKKTEWKREENLNAVRGDVFSSSILMYEPDWETRGDTLVEFEFGEPRMSGFVYTFTTFSRMEKTDNDDE